MSDLRTPAQVVRQELKDGLTNLFKEYYIGDPLQIPQQSMPCIVVETLSEDQLEGPTGLDEVTTTLLIKLIVNKKDDFGKKSNAVLWRQRLEDMVKARDDTTKYYLDKTVMGIVRKKITLGGRFTLNRARIEYGLTPRPQDVITEEAHVTLTLQEFVQVPSRT